MHRAGGLGVWQGRSRDHVHTSKIRTGPHAGHKAPHKCTSWYAYAAMWRQFSLVCSAHHLPSSSMFFRWPCLVSHTLWLAFY